jgi:hypothetical protein
MLRMRVGVLVLLVLLMLLLLLLLLVVVKSEWIVGKRYGLKGRERILVR